VQDVDAAPPLACFGNHRGNGFLTGHIGRERHAFAGPRSHRRGLLGGGEGAIDCEHLGPFLDKAQRRRAPVADALARALPGADDDRDLAFQPHCNLLDAASRAEFGISIGILPIPGLLRMTFRLISVPTQRNSIVADPFAAKTGELLGLVAPIFLLCLHQSAPPSS
jgi:hypothetical protein